VSGFECLPGLAPTLVAGLIQFTRALNSAANRFDLLLLDHSLEYCTHSSNLTLIKAIASLQQSTHKLNALCMKVSAVCVSFIFSCTVKYFFLYLNCSMTFFLRSRVFFNNFLQKKKTFQD